MILVLLEYCKEKEELRLSSTILDHHLYDRYFRNKGTILRRVAKGCDFKISSDSNLELAIGPESPRLFLPGDIRDHDGVTHKASVSNRSYGAFMKMLHETLCKGESFQGRITGGEVPYYFGLKRRKVPFTQLSYERYTATTFILSPRDL